MRRYVAASLGALALAVPVSDAVAAVRASIVAKTPKKKVVTVTRTVTGPEAEASRWGFVKVTLIVKKTTTTVGAKKTVTRKITNASVPEYPNHTDRSVFINQQALPILLQEVLQAQFNPNIELVGGATDSSFAFQQSLQAALIQAKRA